MVQNMISQDLKKTTDTNESLRRFKIRKSAFEKRLAAVREERDDIRHLIAVPIHMRTRQQPLQDFEKDSRLVEIFEKVSRGTYFTEEVDKDICDCLMDKLFNINF
jgi:hypothetical protein